MRIEFEESFDLHWREISGALSQNWTKLLISSW
jgi:hypothetical protein